MLIYRRRSYTNDMTSRRLSLCLAWVMSGFLAPLQAAAVPVAPVMLWQEDSLMDALISEGGTHNRSRRETADPNLIPVLQNVTQQVAQQVLNLEQIEAYTKIQADNLQFAFHETDPETSLATIQSNLDTLSQGTSQIRNNLFYLAVRCRIAATQSLPDPELARTAAVMIHQVQAAQRQLNMLYADATALQNQINARTRHKQNFLRYNASILVYSIFHTQKSIFAVYNAAYEIYLRSKEENGLDARPDSKNTRKEEPQQMVDSAGYRNAAYAPDASSTNEPEDRQEMRDAPASSK